jgi:hypothetical protein
VADAHRARGLRAVMERVHGVIADVEPHDSVERYTGLGVEVLQGHARIQPLDRGDHAGRRPAADADHPPSSSPPAPAPSCRRCRGWRSAGYPDQRHGVGPATELPARLVVLGGGPHRLRAGAELSRAWARRSRRWRWRRASWCARTRRSRSWRRIAAGRRRAGAHRPQALRCERRAARSSSSSNTAGAEQRIEFDELLCAVGRSGAPDGLRPGGTGHPDPRTMRPTNTCRPSTPTSTPRATWPGPSSSPTRPRTRPGTRRSMRCSATFKQVQGRLLGDPLGHLHRPRGGARRPERAGGPGAGHRLRGDALRHRRPGPRDRRQRPPTASSRCSPCRARTASWA